MGFQVLHLLAINMLAGSLVGWFLGSLKIIPFYFTWNSQDLYSLVPCFCQQHSNWHTTDKMLVEHCFQQKNCLGLPQHPNLIAEETANKQN